ncbi:LytR/AlgR family response regulator transcription factor [Flavobacterium sp. RHBU_3]|uniref:LytR/AlgR family response regulator transcription factor n=1 Tax=Flavobacterium sp. RHBU_3 TaxID=3391184 RepID=UPI00398505EF
MTCIIVDDEPLAREGLEAMLAEISDIQVLGKFSNAPAAADFMAHAIPDVVFLDIQMPKVTGLEFASCIPKDTLVVFTTAYSQYALQSYELDALDYLLKPIDKPRLQKAVEKAQLYKSLFADKTTLEQTTPEFLLVKADRRFYKVFLKNILFIEGLKDYVVIHTTGQRLVTAMNLKTFHQQLSAEAFLRVSKSYIVNLCAVDSFDSHNLYIGESEIPLGEIYKSEFMQRYLGNIGTF